eukprot:609003-Rhodomonas_salina.1
MQCEVKKQDQTGPAAQKRESRKVADRQLIGSWQVSDLKCFSAKRYAGWAIEFSAHRVTAAMLEDSKLTFQHEIDEELERLGIPAAEKKKYLLENLLAVPTYSPSDPRALILRLFGLSRFSCVDVLDVTTTKANKECNVCQCVESVRLQSIKCKKYTDEVNKVRKQLYNKVVAFVNELRPKLKAKYALQTSCEIKQMPYKSAAKSNRCPTNLLRNQTDGAPGARGTECVWCYAYDTRF